MEKNFIILDAAMNDLMRPALYGAIHKIMPSLKRIKYLMKIMNLLDQFVRVQIVSKFKKISRIERR